MKESNKPICSRLCFRSAFHFIFSARFNIKAAVVLEGVKPHSLAIAFVRDCIDNGSINGFACDEAADDEREECGRGNSVIVVVLAKT